MALVTSTGFASEQGQLIRSILNPSPQPQHFQQDAYKFLTIIFFICISGVIYLVYIYYDVLDAEYIVLKVCDLVTTTIPPALPAALNVGISIAIDNLKIKYFKTNKNNL